MSSRSSDLKPPPSDVPRYLYTKSYGANSTYNHAGGLCIIASGVPNLECERKYPTAIHERLPLHHFNNLARITSALSGRKTQILKQPPARYLSAECCLA
ncbi:hypothetical protein H0G86_004112 [Trichoderma simmonsii]|uniref:Uncharacterized protein n=1 Tax=Trichoderma simmonsii TaxID=1491479 RepID=A0A8G0L6Y0_9HYPO|nr:hypothetical protein H0G86_004112 [Trichoderma simmonsii]